MNALQSLLVAAQLSGVPSPAPVDMPKPILRLDLKEVARDQDRAWLPLEVGAHTLWLSAGFGPEYELFVKVRQGGVTVALPQSKLEAKAVVALPEGRYRLEYEGGIVRAFALDESGGGQLFAMDLIGSLYRTAVLVRLGVVDYAVLYEDGALIGKSATFLRQDQGGRFYLAYRDAAQLAKIEWLLAVNGIMYGVRLEGGTLGFYSKPVPPVSALSFPERPLL